MVGVYLKMKRGEIKGAGRKLCAKNFPHELDNDNTVPYHHKCSRKRALPTNNIRQKHIINWTITYVFLAYVFYPLQHLLCKIRKHLLCDTHTYYVAGV